MSWREMIKHSRDNSIRRVDEGCPTVATVVTSRSDSDLGRMGEYTFQTAYKTKLVVESVWFANDAQYEYGAKIAERAVAEVLYSGVRQYLNRLREAVFNNRREDAMTLIDKIDEATKP